MSYIIEYDRQFIRSTQGITPVWLSGNSNVTEGYGRNERRVRNWSVFMNLLGVTKEELLDAAKTLTGGSYQEHWKKNGNWVDDAGLVKWVENGCRAAVPIEDIFRSNQMSSIFCYLAVYTGSHTWAGQEMKTYVRDTFEFDSWLVKTKDRIAELKKSGETGLPVIWFNDGERLKHVNQGSKQKDSKVLIKRKGSYLVRVESASTSWARDVKKALVMTYAEAVKVQQDHALFLRDAQIVSAKVLDNPRNLILKITAGKDKYVDCYVVKITAFKFYYSENAGSAKRYSTMAAAKRAAKRVMEICGAGSMVEVVKEEK